MQLFKMPFLFLSLLTIMRYEDSLSGDIKGKATLIGKKNNANVVIYIDKIAGKKFKPPSKPTMMDQKNLEFIPHILPVLVGTEVEFHNSDDVLHNVYTPNVCPEKFDLGTYPKGVVKSRTFDTPGCEAVILCNLHPAMEAYVVVLETPYFAVSPKSGNYEIKNVPAGTYTLKVWHERLKAPSTTIVVPEKGEVKADFELIK